tara:strand:+ start:182 stop:1156 length:975 start_codon:yes stop_codon:yes gene_type:complete
VWRRLGEEAPPVEEPFVADEMLVVGAEIVVPVSMPIVVAATAFEPEVLIQTETLNLTEGQEQEIRENEHAETSRVMNVEFKRLLGDERERDELKEQHTKKCATYNDGVMTNVCLQMAGAPADDMPYLGIVVKREKISKVHSRYPWHIRSIGEQRMSISVYKNEAALNLPPLPENQGTHCMNIPVMDFLQLPHDLKQRLYDPIMWQWVHEVEDEIMDEYFACPFNIQDVTAHLLRVTQEYDGRHLTPDGRSDDVKAAHTAAGKIATFAYQRKEFVQQNKWEQAKNGLFRDLKCQSEKEQFKIQKKTVLGAYCAAHEGMDLQMYQA